MPCIEMQHDFFHSPAMWCGRQPTGAWIAGLMDVLMPSWFHGVPVLAFRSVGFDPEQAFHMMAKHHVTNTLLVPTMTADEAGAESALPPYELKVRS